MSFPIKQSLRKHLVTVHKRDETVAHLHTLFNSIYELDALIFCYLADLIKDSPMTLKSDNAFDSKFAANLKADQVSAPSQMISLKQWEHEKKMEAVNSWKILLEITALKLPVGEQHKGAETLMFSLLNEGGLAHVSESDPCTLRKVLTVYTEWETDGTQAEIETLLDTGCNITAIELDLVRKINTRKSKPVQLAHSHIQ